MTVTTDQDAVAKGWPAPKQEPEGIPADALANWRTAVDRAREIALREGWSRAEVARRADIPAPTLTQLLDGTYNPGSIITQANRLTKWLDAYDETRSLAAALPEVPGWVSTPTAEEVMRTLLLCQQMPDMAVITLGSGMGKTITAAHYCATRPSAYRVTMRPSTATIGKMMHEIAIAVDVAERNPAKLDRAIGARLKRNGRTTLLVIDEAQNLVDQAVDQLRWFLDEYECGVALLGNTDLYTRFGRGTPKEGYGQIHRRIGRRFSRLRPLDKDVDAVIRAWKVEDKEIADLLRAVGRKPGSLGQISKTMQLAAIWAAGDGRAIDAEHVRAAWENRSGGEGAR
jgi:DNA transposition AAA+ family ATPase